MPARNWREHLGQQEKFEVCVHLPGIGGTCREPNKAFSTRPRRAQHSAPISRHQRIKNALDEISQDTFLLCPDWNCEALREDTDMGVDCVCGDGGVTAIVRAIVDDKVDHLLDDDDLPPYLYWVWDYNIEARSPTWWLRSCSHEGELMMTTREADLLTLGMHLADSERGSSGLFEVVASGKPWK